MSLFTELLETKSASRGPLRALSASGQLGYGIPEKAFRLGLDRKPCFIGCDMGSIDVGPYYLGSGKLASGGITTRRDLRLVLNAALAARIPLLIGTAGTAGSAVHLEKTLQIIRSIAVEDGLSFKLATIAADMPRDFLKRMVRDGRTRPLGAIPELTDATIDGASNIVGQMGVEAFIRAMATEPDVIIAGRACDTAIFAAVPHALGYALGPAMHMAKIIECTSICCVPGGRDAMLGTLEGEAFVLESMNPTRAATPLSVAAHSLYEQLDPLTVYEPEGSLHLADARFEAVDERRTRVSGARWQPALLPTIKIEGAEWVGERAILLAGSCDPKVIENHQSIVDDVRAMVSEIIPSEGVTSYDLIFHTYGQNGVSLFGHSSQPADAREIFFLVECIARTAEVAQSVAGVTKQYLLHHGFPGRMSTGGNVAFPFTPPEMAANTAYRFSIYHVTECDDIAALFPVTVETIKPGSSG